MTETNIPSPQAFAAARPALPSSAAAFGAYDVKAFEVPDTVREFAEKGVANVREAYETMKTAAEEATDMIEDTYENARKGYVDFNLKMIAQAQANTDRAFAFAKELVSVKSMSEAVELQTKFAREQFEAFASQTKELQDLSTRYASEAAGPMREAWERSTDKMRAA